MLCVIRLGLVPLDERRAVTKIRREEVLGLRVFAMNCFHGLPRSISSRFHTKDNFTSEKVIASGESDKNKERPGQIIEKQGEMSSGGDCLTRQPRADQIGHDRSRHSSHRI